MAVTLSSKGQIMIPRQVRDRMGWKPGQKLEPIVWGGVVQLVPVLPMEQARGMFRGLTNDFQREKKDREF